MFKLDQKGMSLPIVLAVAAIIGANSYYFLVSQKNAKVTTALTRTDITEDAEKRRIAAVLSDFNVCTANFGTKTMSVLKTPNASGITAITKSGTNVISVGTNFTTATGSPAFNSNVDHTIPTPFSETSRVARIYLNETPDIVGAPPQQVRVSLRIELETLASAAVGATGKKIKLISIPLYIDFDSYPTNVPTPVDTRKIVRCYARPDAAIGQSGMFEAIRASCLTNSTSDTHLTTAGCEHIMNPLDCGPNKNRFLNSIGINLSTNAIEFACGTYQVTAGSMVTNCDATGKVGQAIVNSQLQCDYLNACTSGATQGSAMIKSTSGTVYNCLQSCNVTDVWHSTDTSTGNGTSTCYPRLYTCADGYYAKSISSTGAVDCQPITYKSKNCSATQFATHFDTTSSTGDLLHCAAFTKARTCPSQPKFSYVTSLGTQPTPSCTTLN